MGAILGNGIDMKTQLTYLWGVFRSVGVVNYPEQDNFS